jgi:hypothetical protein
MKIPDPARLRADKANGARVGVRGVELKPRILYRYLGGCKCFSFIVERVG